MNPLLETDVYKMGHMEQYAPGTTKVYSYLTARSDKHWPVSVFFGLQYYLKRYLQTTLTAWMGEEFLAAREEILGCANPPEVVRKIRELCKLGYWPLKIKALPEGTVVNNRTPLMTITNTHPDFYWCVGFVESLLLKVWYPTTVATCCRAYRIVADEAWEATVDEPESPMFHVHDFGYRGDTSVEGAALSGAAHLLSFCGSDTVPALKFVKDYYAGKGLIMASVPASEHSVMCSYGRENEIAAFDRMLDLYPSGIVSIVSDTFDVYKVLTDFAEQLKPKILARDGKVVFRPDSGNPEHIICGDPTAPQDSKESKGAVRLLDEMFGSTTNAKGYKVLNPKVGLIYGDGMYLERYQRTLDRLASMGYAASNLAIGVGGILRNHTRDTLGFAIKATHVVVDGKPRDIEKDPVTDPGKKSLKGLMRVDYDALTSRYITRDQCTPEDEDGGQLVTSFIDGYCIREYDFATARVRAQMRGLR